MLFKIFYTDLMIQSKFAAQTYGPFIFIRPLKKDDIGLREHEKVHVKQFWNNPLFGLWYLFSKKSRAEFEAEAYREQLKHTPGKESVFANHLATKYNLGISQVEALEMLSTKDKTG